MRHVTRVVENPNPRSKTKTVNERFLLHLYVNSKPVLLPRNPNVVFAGGSYMRAQSTSYLRVKSLLAVMNLMTGSEYGEVKRDEFFETFLFTRRTNASRVKEKEEKWIIGNYTRQRMVK